MRVYVATKWEKKDEAAAAMAALRVDGHTITHDWTMAAEENEPEAWADLHAVTEADALVILAEWDLPYSGTLVEMGLALAWRIPVYIVGPYIDNIFTHVSLVKRHPTLFSVRRALAPYEV